MGFATQRFAVMIHGRPVVVAAYEAFRSRCARVMVRTCVVWCGWRSSAWHVLVLVRHCMASQVRLTERGSLGAETRTPQQQQLGREWAGRGRAPRAGSHRLARVVPAGAFRLVPCAGAEARGAADQLRPRRCRCPAGGASICGVALVEGRMLGHCVLLCCALCTCAKGIMGHTHGEVFVCAECECSAMACSSTGRVPPTRTWPFPG